MVPVSSPCAACKFLRRKCSSECIFAPFFPPDQMQKFIHVHRVYGASNVQKLLAELPVDQRQDAVNSLAYQAETRRLDPVYGCIGPIAFLQHRVKHLQGVLQDAYKELAAYQYALLQTQQAMGVSGFPAAQPTPDMMHSLGVNPLSSSSSSEPYKMASMMGIPTRGSSLEIREPGPQSNNNNNTFHPEQLFMPIATVGTEQQETIRAFELQQHGQDIRFNGSRGFDVGAGSSTGVGVVGFSLNDPPSPLQVSPQPIMGSFESGFSRPHFQPQLSLQPQQVMAVQEHHMQEPESQEERLQGLNVGKGDAETGSSFYYPYR